MTDVRGRIKVAVLRALTAKADSNGEIHGVRVIDIAKSIGRSNAEVAPALKHLIAEQQITRLRYGNNQGPAIYRLGGPVIEVDPFVPSIDSVTVYTPNRTSFGIPDPIPISLPRLKCLETHEIKA